MTLSNLRRDTILTYIERHLLKLATFAVQKRSVEKPEYQLTIDEIRSIRVDDLLRLGFLFWDENLIQFPRWFYDLIADGEVLVAISDRRKYVKGVDEVQLSTGFGCIAYGFFYDPNRTEPKSNVIALERKVA